MKARAEYFKKLFLNFFNKHEANEPIEIETYGNVANLF